MRSSPAGEWSGFPASASLRRWMHYHHHPSSQPISLEQRRPRSRGTRQSSQLETDKRSIRTPMARERNQHTRARLGPDSYRPYDGIARWRLVMSIALPLVVLVLFVIAPAWNGGPALSRWGRFASPGPLIRSHAAWESRCEVCHLPFSPVARSKVSDQKCQVCHDRRPHHKSQMITGVPACGSCHSDHRGRETSLVRMDDSSCIQCHRALAPSRNGDAGPLTIATSVTRFDGNPAHHPEFRWLRQGLTGDPGQVIFNHKLHLAHGLTSGPEGKPFTFEQLPEAAPTDTVGSSGKM